MGTPNRLDCVLDRFRISSSELDIAEWVAIIREVLGLMKPHLKYLPGFKEVGEYLNFTRGNHQRLTPESAIKTLPLGFDVTTRCLIFKSMGSVEVRPRIIQEESILLTQRGELAWWNVWYVGSVTEGGSKEVASRAEFSWIYDKELESLLRRNRDYGKDFLSALRRLVGEGIAERTQRLRSVQELDQKIFGILARLNMC